jgi:predicted nucleotidyltransferase
MLDIEARDIALVRDILERRLRSCEIRAYGSRVGGTAHQGSDLDLAIVGPSVLDPLVLSELRSDFEESDLPFPVDLIDWNAAPESFREAIARRYEVIDTEHPSI